MAHGTRAAMAAGLVGALLVLGQMVASASTGSAVFLRSGDLGASVHSLPDAISCSGSGDCVVGGSWYEYSVTPIAKPNMGGLLATEARGTWSSEKDSRANNAVTPQNADYTSVSCFSTGNCVAGGYFSASHGVDRALVAIEANGKWKTPSTVPGLSKLGSIILKNLGGATSIGSKIYSVSCGAKGDCLVGGTYADKRDVAHAFTASIINGVVQPVRVVIGRVKPPAFDSNVKIEYDSISQVSCGASTSCVITGRYQTTGNTSESFRSFVQVEKNGVWSPVRAVFAPTVATQGLDGQSLLTCPTASYCALVGSNDDSNIYGGVYVTTERSGVWSVPATIPGLAALSTVRGTNGSDNNPDLVCTAPGQCILTGEYSDGSTVGLAAFLAQETNGVWGRATPVPGLSAFAGKGGTEVDSVSCSTPRNCALVGTVTPPMPPSATTNVNDTYPFVVTEVNGSWSAPRFIPGLHPTPANASIQSTAVSCAHGGTCTFLGSYFSPQYAGVSPTPPLNQEIVTYTFAP